MGRLLTSFFALTASLAVVPLSLPAQAAAITIAINGTPLALDQPPVERIGRVYVPLRGIFEALGASVVFQGGKINATRGSTTVALQIGSTTAFVDNGPKTLDAAPFLIGARTLVPLRFIAESLGAVVVYENATQTVAITQPNGAPPPAFGGVRVVHLQPAAGATVYGRRPEVSATFDHPVNPNAVRIFIDERDVTSSAYVSPRAVSYEPTFDLPFGPHHTAIRGPRYHREWNFTNAPLSAPNVLNGLSPANGAHVGGAFVVRGFTRPRATVVVVAVANARVPFGEVNASSVSRTVRSDDRGSFAAPITIDDQGSGIIDVRIESRSYAGATIVRTLRLLP
jgi:hypothetical protein